MEENPLIFSKAIMKKDNELQSSPYRYVGVLQTKAFHYCNLFIHCMSLLEKLTKEYPGFKLFFGSRIKIFDEMSFIQKDWSWYGRRSHSLEDVINPGFKLFPFKAFSKEIIQALWKIEKDNWEVEFYVYDTIPFKSRLATLAFYRFGEGVELRSSHKPFSELLHNRMFMQCSLSRKVAVEYGTIAMQKLRWRINQNMLPK
ncbi:hypothetical protein HN784_00110 [bacterium]|nr:hypothetical protein [bacterium]MBT4251017.1 hypothetical protein [bacterium]MBT7037442.1 hypothetical protein [bacterium]MBT7431239.1 hypothetical protein [bacterium]MBT7993220.1 hypothetical protein [bacterium]